jgi:tetratricopeptide (TPR) repeat protein
LTAESEFTVIQAAHVRPSTARPATARPSTSTTGHAAHTETTATATYAQYPSISRYIPLLLEAIEKEKTYVEDEFQAQVCLGWIHWQLGEPSLAASRLPKSIEHEFAQLDGTNKESAGWTKVCALKASYIKGDSQGRTGAVAEALESYESALPILTSVSSSRQQPKELRSWMELYLTGFCMLSSHAVKSKLSSILETETLSAFRAWSKFWEVQGPTPAGGRALQADVSRRQVWKEYYVTLSDVLQQGLPFPTTSLTTAYAETSTRLQQRAELKRVEARYEALLLAEVQFPKADEASDEVEAFVDLVIQNWRILCGSSWNEQDLGEGGAEAVSRGVLDILYRAATKTFHSTRILRHLFTVHLAVAEFDLAFKAFDTYMEIVKKAKARVEKTGEVEHGLDDDETVLRTASECIKALCRHGSRQGAEKAKDLGQFFEDWLDKHHPSDHRSANGRLLENGNSGSVETPIPPRVFALAWRCIGISHAQWGRLTYDAPSRSDIQLRAIKCFRKALLPQYESTHDVETLFALGTILAERRELAAAIEVVKAGLLPRSNIANGLGPQVGRFSRERSLIQLWHLLSLLLSARQDFLTAARSCEGAFEQFQDPKNLFGEADLNGVYRSDHLNEKRIGRSQGGVVDDMDDFERENVLEVKMTQLALIEVLEGPEVAVNASDELLSLYTRLFVDPKTESIPTVSGTTLSAPPKSSAGTIKSITGSIFGRSGRSVRKSVTAGSSLSEKTLVARPKTAQTLASTRAPTIQVTSENGTAAKQHHHHEKLQKRSDSVSKKKGPGSARERSTSTGRRRSDSGAKSSESHNPTTVDGEKIFAPPADTQNQDQWLSRGVAAAKNTTSTSSSPNSRPGSKPLPPASQQMTHKEPSLKVAHPNLSLAQDNRLPHVSPYSSSTSPVTRFPKDQQRRRRTTILVKVWLLVSGFYRRAALYDDAKGGIEEAQKLVQKLEADVSNDTSGKVAIDHPGSGGGKSVAELWSDVFSEVSVLYSIFGMFC